MKKDWKLKRRRVRDPRAGHKAVISVKNLIKMFPPRDQWNSIVEVLGDEPDVNKLAICYLEWSGRGYNKMNFNWITDWYAFGIPGRKEKQNEHTKV